MNSDRWANMNLKSSADMAQSNNTHMDCSKVKQPNFSPTGLFNCLLQLFYAKYPQEIGVSPYHTYITSEFQLKLTFQTVNMPTCLFLQNKTYHGKLQIYLTLYVCVNVNIGRRCLRYMTGIVAFFESRFELLMHFKLFNFRMRPLYCCVSTNYLFE